MPWPALIRCATPGWMVPRRPAESSWVSVPESTQVTISSLAVRMGGEPGARGEVLFVVRDQQAVVRVGGVVMGAERERVPGVAAVDLGAEPIGGPLHRGDRAGRTH